MGRIGQALIRPFRSRKFRTAVATIVVAIAAEAGLDLNEATVIGIITVGVSIILGIAIEDHGAKSRAEPARDQGNRCETCEGKGCLNCADYSYAMADGGQAGSDERGNGASGTHPTS